MKKIILSIGIIATGICAYAQQIEMYPCQNGEVVVPWSNGSCDPSTFELVFEDNFDGNSIDQYKWNPREGVFRDYDHNNEQQWYSPSNAIVSNGTLKLTAKIEPLYKCYDGWVNNAVQHYCQNFSYTSAEIDSRFQFGEGMYEIRCKIPKGKGFWPAFWTYGYGSIWSEIDVFEFANKYNVQGYLDLDKSVKQHGINTHYDWDGDGHSENCPTSWDGPDFSADFHTFTMFWTGNEVDWFVDGQLKKVKTLMYSMQGQQVGCNGIKANTQYVADKSFPRVVPVNIIANLAIQSGNQGPSLTPFPSALEIDYIRYYKRLPCWGTQTFTSTPQLNLSSTYYNVITGTTINMNTNVTLQGGQQLAVAARDKIDLKPGFSVTAGGTFHGKITPSVCYVGPMKTNDGQEQAIDPSLIEQLTTAVEKEKEQRAIELFPNPTSGQFVINFNGRDLTNYKTVLTDTQGNELVAPLKVENSKLEMDISNFTSGMYFLKIMDTKSGQVESHKIIKN